MLTDIEIAHNTKLKRIDEVAQQLGIDPEAIEYYGKHIAKLPLSLIDEKKKGKLILVTAITATKAGALLQQSKRIVPMLCFCDCA